MKGLGLQFSYADAREIIAGIDENKDGGIDFNGEMTRDKLSQSVFLDLLTWACRLEFLQLMTQAAKHEDQDVNKELVEAFAVFDKDGSGTISPSELRQVLISQGQKYTPDEINEMITQVDLDGDGMINCKS